jgi:hypothetical protein
MQIACTILSSVACPALRYFSTLSHKRHDFRKGVLENKIVFFFSLHLLSETFLILKKKWVRYDPKCVSVFMQSSCHSCQILMIIEFSGQYFEKNTRISNFMNICPVGTELFHADERTDMTKLSVTFRNFANEINKLLN